MERLWRIRKSRGAVVVDADVCALWARVLLIAVLVGIPTCHAEWDNLTSLVQFASAGAPSPPQSREKENGLHDDFDFPDTVSYNFTTDWFSSNNGPWIDNLSHLKGQPNRLGLEIGSYEGRSATWTLTHILTHPSSRLICCDLFLSPYFPRFLNNTRAFRRQRRIFIRQGSTADTLSDPLVTSGRYDMIVVDAGHSSKNVILDTLRTWPLLKVGGVMIFDDYLWQDLSDSTPKPAIDKFLEWFGDELQVLHKGYQVLVKKTRGYVKDLS